MYRSGNNSWFATTWQGGHVGSQNKRIFPRRIYIKIEFSSQRREMLLFLTTNMAAVRSRANQQLQVAATCCGDTSPQQIASSVLEKFCENLCLCNRILSPRQVTQNTVWFNFLQLVAATKFCWRKSKNSLVHTNRFVTATCPVAATCRLVCTDLKLQRKP